LQGRIDKADDRMDSKVDIFAPTSTSIQVPEMGRLPMASGNAGHVKYLILKICIHFN
jgi:hypothetical protein